MKLTSMKDYVIEFSNILNSVELRKYAEFLDQPLTLGMFVPFGEDGEVLDKPCGFNNFLEYGTNDFNNIEKCKQYQAAKDRVLFEGWDKSIRELEERISMNQTIENLAIGKLTITKSALKQIFIE